MYWTPLMLVEGYVTVGARIAVINGANGTILSPPLVYNTQIQVRRRAKVQRIRSFVNTMKED